MLLLVRWGRFVLRARPPVFCCLHRQEIRNPCRYAWYLSMNLSLIGGHMRYALRLSLLLVISSLLTSCAAGSQTGSSRPSGSRNRITQEQLAELPVGLSCMDAVRRLRSSWLRVRGAAGLSSSQTVQVYVDNVHAGGLDFLNSRPLDGIVEIRYYSGTDATTKWGTGVGGGVIELITARR